MLCSPYAVLSVDGNGVRNFYGGITTKNIGNPKIVKVRYTTDNWATYQEVNATYITTSSDNIDDYWNFNVSVPNTVNQVQYAVSYTVNGVTYWDNNFGSNYTVNY